MKESYQDMIMVPAGSLLPEVVLSDNSLVILPGHNNGPTIERYPLLLRRRRENET